MKLSFAISPCPNDTFIYGAIANNLIDLPCEFNFSYHDIQTLNLMAQEGKTDLIKMSFYNYFKVKDHYKLLPTGGALGIGCGPLLISMDNNVLKNHDRPRIAIPGINTTAYFLLNFYNPELINLVEMQFDQIEHEILEGKVDAGVIIHENRFTYQEKGLKLVEDLGVHWENVTKSPIPLGCLAIKRDLDADMGDKITELVKQSILYANHNFDSIRNYIYDHAKEMDPEVIQSHIDLYVNDFSYDMGVSGWKAVDEMGKQVALMEI